jgi:transposase InsO family protein
VYTKPVYTCSNWAPAAQNGWACATDRMLHSDQGTQYNSLLLAQKLTQYNLQGSMSRRGNPYDSAVMERTICILKQEFGLRRRFQELEALEQTVSLLRSVPSTVYGHTLLWGKQHRCSITTPPKKHCKCFLGLDN